MSGSLEPVRRKYDIATVQVFPGFHPEYLGTIAEDRKALVIIGFAAGSIPENLSLAIKELTNRGIPVFILADKLGKGYGRDIGTTRMTDVPHLTARDAGVTYIEKKNIQHEWEVNDRIQDGIDAGLTGKALAEYVYKAFAYGSDEERPKTVWEKDPKGVIEAFKDRVEREIGQSVDPGTETK